MSQGKSSSTGLLIALGAIAVGAYLLLKGQGSGGAPPLDVPGSPGPPVSQPTVTAYGGGTVGNAPFPGMIVQGQRAPTPSGDAFSPGFIASLLVNTPREVSGLGTQIVQFGRWAGNVSTLGGGLKLPTLPPILVTIGSRNKDGSLNPAFPGVFNQGSNPFGGGSAQ